MESCVSEIRKNSFRFLEQTYVFLLCTQYFLDSMVVVTNSSMTVFKKKKWGRKGGRNGEEKDEENKNFFFFGSVTDFVQMYFFLRLIVQ